MSAIFPTFTCSLLPFPLGNFSFIFNSGDTMKTTTCGAPCHTQLERPTSLLGKVLYWIKQTLLFLNQYCETIKGVKARQAHTKDYYGGRGPAGSSPWKHRVWFRSKENCWSGNNGTFRKNTAVPPSLPAALSLSRCLLFFLSVYLQLNIFNIYYTSRSFLYLFALVPVSNYLQ